MSDPKSDHRKTPDLTDFVAIIGLGLLSYGLWQVYQPLAFIVAGALIIIAAMALARK